MAKERLSMRMIKEVLRLKFDCHLSNRQIAVSCRLARSTIADYLRRVAMAGLLWGEISAFSESDLEARLFPQADKPSISRPLPDFAYIQDELRAHKKFNLTLSQLWQEYKENTPGGYQYSQFCLHYRDWLKKQDLCMRQDHKGGEKLFVDYCDGLYLTDSQTGQQTSTQLFVAVWGASNYTYAEASLTQELPSWIGSHRRAFEYFGVAPHLVVPDNLKSGVSKACRYEPDLNPTYAEMAEHYGTAILPARPRKPRDKAKAEAGAIISQRWILSVLRHRVFTSLSEMNAAIRELLERLNTRPMRKIKKSRRELFDLYDRPCARPLPSRPYEYADWKKAIVNIDYHIAADDHYYSVPWRHRGECVDVRFSTGTVEVFLKGERIAAHARSFVKYKHTTLAEHMPPDHRKYAEWTPSRIKNWASKTGPSTVRFVEVLMESRAHPEQAYRSCLGVFRLSQSYPVERIEAAAERAIRYNACSYKSLKLILERSLDRQKEREAIQGTLPFHENIRGGEYYQ